MKVAQLISELKNGRNREIPWKQDRRIAMQISSLESQRPSARRGWRRASLSFSVAGWGPQSLQRRHQPPDFWCSMAPWIEFDTGKDGGSSGSWCQQLWP